MAILALAPGLVNLFATDTSLHIHFATRTLRYYGDSAWNKNFSITQNVFKNAIHCSLQNTRSFSIKNRLNNENNLNYFIIIVYC